MNYFSKGSLVVKKIVQRVQYEKFRTVEIDSSYTSSYSGTTILRLRYKFYDTVFLLYLLLTVSVSRVNSVVHVDDPYPITHNSDRSISSTNNEYFSWVLDKQLNYCFRHDFPFLRYYNKINSFLNVGKTKGGNSISISLTQGLLINCVNGVQCVVPP